MLTTTSTSGAESSRSSCCEDGGRGGGGGTVFPEDVVFQILSWLPVTSLLRFKSVCKSWYALIDTPAFINLHVHHHLHRRRDPAVSKVLLMNTHHQFDEHSQGINFSFLYGENFEVSKELHLPSLSKVYIPSSSNTDMTTYDGIVCLCCKVDCRINNQWVYIMDFFLWNPFTNQSRPLPRLPHLPYHRNTCSHYASLGFGFDPKTNDYKVVRILKSEEQSSSSSRVEVYSLSTDSWATSDAVVPPHLEYITSHPRTPYRDSTYCWFARGPPVQFGNLAILFKYYVLSFDFADEVFTTTPLPETYNIKSDVWPCFAILKGNIACINSADPFTSKWKDNLKFEIWVLNEYGVKESWTKLYTIGPFLRGRPLAFLKNGELLLLRLGKQLCIYHLLTQDVKILSFFENALAIDVLKIAAYKESLVSIERGCGKDKGLKRSVVFQDITCEVKHEFDEALIREEAVVSWNTKLLYYSTS